MHGSDASDVKGALPQLPPLLQRIREEFQKCCGTTDGERISAEDLARYWERLAEEEQRVRGRPRLTMQNKQVIALRVAQLMTEMKLLHTADVELQEWIHYMLLMSLGRAGFASKQVNSLLCKALAKNRSILTELQRMFDAADTSKSGLLGMPEVVAMYNKRLWSLKPADVGPARQLTEEELRLGDPEDFARAIVKAMDVNGDNQVSYPEFMAYSLGRRKHEVLLHLYDLSNGAATQMAPWVIGEHLEGVWHTGTVVYGKDYYSKDTVFADAGDTSFGKPTRTVHLGYTLWRQDELHEFVTAELKPVFQRDTYDVVCNNCNHFTDRLCMFLVGKRAPEEVLRQPGLLMKSRSVRVIRPLLNWWLRDRIVVREKGFELPPGQQRLKHGEQPLLGKIVSVHAEKNERPPCLAKVCSPTDLEGEGHAAAVTMGSARGRSPDKGSGLEAGGCGGLWSTCSVVRGGPETGAGMEQDGVWVQYLDIDLGVSDTASSSRAQVRIECVLGRPSIKGPWRLSKSRAWRRGAKPGQPEACTHAWCPCQAPWPSPSRGN